VQLGGITDLACRSPPTSAVSDRTRDTPDLTGWWPDRPCPVVDRLPESAEQSTYREDHRCSDGGQVDAADVPVSEHVEFAAGGGGQGSADLLSDNTL
jgi:hypothetical protein